MEPTTLLLVASFLAPMPVTRKSIFTTEENLEYPFLSAPLFTTQTVNEDFTPLSTVQLATDAPSLLRTPLENEIAAFASLPDDWDGDGAKSPSTETIISATLIAKYSPKEYHAKAMASSSGAISLYWEYSGRYAELGVESDQSCYFFARDYTGRELFIENLPVHEVASREWLSENLRKICELDRELLS